MPFKSPYNHVDIPKRLSVPEFILRPLDSKRDDLPLLHPSPYAGRAHSPPLSLNETRTKAYAMATQLRARGNGGFGWEKNDVLILYSENQHDYLVVALAVMLAGGVAALMNPQNKQDEAVQMMRLIKPRLIVASVATLETAQKSAAEYAGGADAAPRCYVFEEDHAESLEKHFVVPGVARRREGDRCLERVEIDPPRDAAVYCFSSGTSGLPKVVRLSHFSIVANMIQTVVTLGGRMNKPRFDDAQWFDQPLAPPQDGTDAFHLSILPQFHCYGLLMAFACLFTVTPCVVFARFNVDHFFETVQTYRVTFIFVVPPMLHALAMSPVADKYDLSSIRSFASGAASLSKELCNLVLERHGIPVTDGYGMTEMSPVIALQTPEDLGEGNLNVGRLVANTEARVLDLSTGEDVGPNAKGELWLRGPQMMLGYLENATANACAFVPNVAAPGRYLRTGDVVAIDERGYVTLYDRLKDIIKYNGYQVAASELEELLHAYELVLEAAVVGIRDNSTAVHNELPWAFVVPKEYAKAAPEEQRTKELLTYINSRVAGYKKIRGVSWVAALPKTAAGKVLKRELRAHKP
ncbi:hypothetical protein MSPP1_002683 [Malassezia sp. CBS 17886]|nr:hypothetical protein MSPP1_002683 [Malassezia sp. CBS 17886]